MTDENNRPRVADLAERTNARNAEDHLRAVAFNAMLEAMATKGRLRFTAMDARRAHVIFQGLIDVPDADLEKAPAIVVAPLQAPATPLLDALTEATEKAAESTA